MKRGMSVLPPSQMRAMRLAPLSEARSSGAQPVTADPAAPLDLRWSAIAAGAAQLAAMAGLSSERAAFPQDAGFASQLDGAESWQVDLARRGIEDIEAMMDIGMRALGNLAGRGRDVHVPALALWREVFHARTAVLAAVAPHAEAA